MKDYFDALQYIALSETEFKGRSVTGTVSVGTADTSNSEVSQTAVRESIGVESAGNDHGNRIGNDKGNGVELGKGSGLGVVESNGLGKGNGYSDGNGHSDGNIKPLDVLVIRNTDGTPRWIIPTHAHRPWFLHFYHVASLRTRVYAMVMQLLFLLRVHTLFLEKQRWYLIENHSGDLSGPSVDLHRDQWALFTGTTGPNNKLVLYTRTGERGYFRKIAVTPSAQQLLVCEHQSTKTLDAMHIRTFDYPHAEMESDNTLKSVQVGENGVRANILGLPHSKALTELLQHTLQLQPMWFLPHVRASLESLTIQHTEPDRRIPASLVRKLEVLVASEESSNVWCAFSHGDFTPWNLVIRDGRLAMFDLEMGGLRPAGFDAFHFVVQKGILIDRKPWSAIRREIEETVVPWLRPLIGPTGKDWMYYLRMYLLINTAYHVGLYSRQAEWHTQVYWLMQTWNEALTDMLSGVESQRGMLIEDVFFQLHHVPYVAIKFPEAPPARLDPYSDIDIAIGKNQAEALISMLRKHPLAASVRLTRNSFMDSVQVILNDRSILNLDLLWNFKRKNLQMMDLGQVLDRAEMNRFGIKAMHAEDLLTYLILFYGLNGKPVPKKFQSLIAGVKPGHPMFAYIREGHATGTPEVALLHQWTKQLEANKGFAALQNGFTYLWDTVRSYLGSRGMVITFSGVDGAGKSTVIEHVRFELEKKLRKRVVVLRHRPSILPILSAWTKGKAKAEQDAASTLPRQGQNRSQLNSLIRFAYYYADYLAGQFVVWARHIRRGDIVLYDRYYFDFINDSVRSNITLPPSILRAGYRLLIKPDLNFFLYADADVILSRKQELDRQTISDLTSRYLKLFDELNGNAVVIRYIPLENRRLQDTLHAIFNRINQQAA
jgi:thymidylate kinase